MWHSAVTRVFGTRLLSGLGFGAAYPGRPSAVADRKDPVLAPALDNIDAELPPTPLQSAGEPGEAARAYAIAAMGTRLAAAGPRTRQRLVDRQYPEGQPAQADFRNDYEARDRGRAARHARQSETAYGYAEPDIAAGDDYYTDDEGENWQDWVATARRVAWLGAAASCGFAVVLLAQTQGPRIASALREAARSAEQAAPGGASPPAQSPASVAQTAQAPPQPQQPVQMAEQSAVPVSAAAPESHMNAPAPLSPPVAAPQFASAPPHVPARVAEADTAAVEPAAPIIPQAPVVAPTLPAQPANIAAAPAADGTADVDAMPAALPMAQAAAKIPVISPPPGDPRVAVAMSLAPDPAPAEPAHAPPAFVPAVHAQPRHAMTRAPAAVLAHADTKPRIMRHVTYASYEFPRWLTDYKAAKPHDVAPRVVTMSPQPHYLTPPDEAAVPRPAIPQSAPAPVSKPKPMRPPDPVVVASTNYPAAPYAPFPARGYYGSPSYTPYSAPGSYYAPPSNPYYAGPP